MDYLSPIVKLVEVMNSKKTTRFDELEKFNRLSPEICSAISIPVENAKELKKILKITVDPQQVPSLLRMQKKWNLSHRELTKVYRHGYVKYNPFTDECELTSESQRTDSRFYAIMFGITLCILAGTRSAVYSSPVDTGYDHPADPIFAKFILITAILIFTGVVFLWFRILSFYMESRGMKKLVRKILDRKNKK